jgi:selenide, water dikinase
MEKVRLTQMVNTAGCAAKLFPHILSEALKDIDWQTNENVLVGFSGKDDAGIYKITDDLALIHTTDFFTPVVDDPFVFGKIAAANSLSDVYAMGGTPLNALNIVAFPQKEDISILKEILRGGNEKAKEAGCVIIGGHSVDIPSILYGMAVTGKINPVDIKGNDTATPGDILILTKCLGTGLLNNTVKYKNPPEDIVNKLIASMCRLNKNAAELMIKYNTNGCTDVTGFGLAGHSMQMAQSSHVVLNINVNELPVLPGAFRAIEENLLTRGDKSNRFYTEKNVINSGEINLTVEHLLYDPQTSGGLLISVPEKYSKTLLDELVSSGDEDSKIIGFVQSPSDDFKGGTVIFNFKN